MAWYSHPLKSFPVCCDPQNKGFSVAKEADVFLPFPCFFYDPMDLGNLISGSSTFFFFLNILQVYLSTMLQENLHLNFDLI